ncbi:MAG TPA: TIGR04190 family B12-binding domain/radical SAM domain protein [Bryobacteraceae bacterium]|jgi:B12-binding domain/radical SAM domain protein|nr:TIGR04190 family B12-binding domain/radical SAM domain protein [Bryobacteraceae bacterium]
MARDTPLDLLLLHAPSVFDFREKSIFYGPISDVIPSSTVFEMYPLGFLTILSYLQAQGMRVRIVNLAVRMMKDRKFPVRDFLASVHPSAVGIDLHWLPHAHGALEVARLVKEIHPDVPVIMGGLSSTYFHQELIDYQQVDFVLRGDSTEIPLYQLLLALKNHEPLDRIPNLTWKQSGLTRVNPMTFLPATLDYVDLRADLMVEMVLRYGDLGSVVPFVGWLKNPITAVFTVKGCAHNCATCGSSSTTCGHLTKRIVPAFRSPESLVANIVALSRLIRAPIFLVGDLLQAGAEHAEAVLERLKEVDVENQVVFEFFDLPSIDFLQRIDASVRNWSIELSPESHDPKVRGAQEGEAPYNNDQFEEAILEALRLRCTRIDVFFMIGMPEQTYQSVQDTAAYCERLFEISDRRLSCFISPMGPFLDPGSRIFEAPEQFGYRVFARSLEDHRKLLVEPSWERMLSYETKWMTRAELVDATYDAAESLNRAKLKYGRISTRRGQTVAQRIRDARELRARLAAGEGEGVLAGEISKFSESTVCDKRELFWARHLINFKIGGVLGTLGRYCFGREKAGAS